jgi:hypothetical protein
VIYVGIDQSYGGFATTLYDPETGDHETIVRSFEASGYPNQGARLNDVWGYVLTLTPPKSLKRAAMEGYSMGSKFGREKLGELGGIVKMGLWAFYGQDPAIVTPSTLKKFVLGGSAGRGKNLMLLGVYKKWGVEFNDDNAADSYALARLAHLLDHPEQAEHKYEQEVIKTVLKEGTK